MHGVLSIDKPPGCSSRDVVNHVQRLVRPLKVGHAGTLDPIATGVLLVCVGQATRLVEYLHLLPKQYVGTFRLGVTSPTEDIEGTLEPLDNPPIPSEEELQQACRSLTGEIKQRPPAFSALKVDGRRAYKLARKGRDVELPLRDCQIHRLQLLSFDYPEFEVDVTCSSGTYIRSLGRDLAEAVGSGAVMCSLRRTAIGPFDVEQAVTMEQIDSDSWQQFVTPPAECLPNLPLVRLNVEEVAAIRSGRYLPLPVPAPTQDLLRGVDEQGRLIAILTVRQQQLAPRRVFPDDSSPAS